MRTEITEQSLQDAVLENMEAEWKKSTDAAFVELMIWHKLKSEGWTEVILTIAPEQYHDMLDWVSEHCPMEYMRDGTGFLFKSANVATMFTLKWAK